MNDAFVDRYVWFYSKMMKLNQFLCIHWNCFHFYDSVNRPDKTDKKHDILQIIRSLAMWNFTAHLNIYLWMKLLFSSCSTFLWNLTSILFWYNGMQTVLHEQVYLWFNHILGKRQAECLRGNKSYTCNTEKSQCETKRGRPQSVYEKICPPTVFDELLHKIENAYCGPSL
jgi:hypothetical protein